MNPKRRTPLLIGLVIAALLFVMAGSYKRLATERTQAEFATQDLAECKRLTQQIDRLSAAPTRVSENEIGAGRLAQRIQDAARSASLPVESIIRLTPEPARQLGQSPYKEKPTKIHLRSVSLAQLLPFLRTLSQETSGATDQAELTVKSTRLSAPRNASDEKMWNADVTLSYLIYDPQDR